MKYQQGASQGLILLFPFPVLADEFGVRDRVGILQALLGQKGIMQVQVPSLNTRERVKLESAFEK